MANILIIDSMASIRQLMLLTLKESGFEVFACGDEVCALEAVEQQNFDLVLTGFDMPRMNGLELTKQLRAVPNYQLTPIIMVSPKADIDVLQQGKQVGVTDWLVKPFNPETLLATIRNSLPSNVDCTLVTN